LTLSALNKAGALLFVGVAQFSVFLIVAESFYKGYSVSNNYTSDLGATCNSLGCNFVQPSSIIFNTSIIILGLFILSSAYFLFKAVRKRILTACIFLSGIGCVGVGTFTEAAGILHGIFSLITFVFIGLSAIFAYSIQKNPMKYFSVIAGIATLFALILYMSKIYMGLGVGGMERMVVYPVLVWALGFGGHLMALKEEAAFKSTQMQ
jgi:hypothetical membrane protein